jgi:hypothetical protein
MIHAPITAWAVPGHSERIALFKDATAAELYAQQAQRSLPVRLADSQAHPCQSPTAWAVRAADGAISLHHDDAIATHYAVRTHGTRHALYAQG